MASAMNNGPAPKECFQGSTNFFLNIEMNNRSKQAEAAIKNEKPFVGQTFLTPSPLLPGEPLKLIIPFYHFMWLTLGKSNIVPHTHRQQDKDDLREWARPPPLH